MRTIAIVLTWLAIVSHASAQSAAAPTPRARVVGAGFGVGFGGQTWTDYALGPGEIDQHLLASLGSFELSAFVDDHFSIDVSAQLGQTIVAACFGDFEWASTVYFDWSVGEQHRLLVGPGIGVVGHSSFETAGTLSRTRPDAGAELRLAGLLGYELLPDDRRFGFRILTRPWLSLGGGDRGFELGGGGLLELAFLFYAT